jgi:cell division protein FtsA
MQGITDLASHSFRGSVRVGVPRDRLSGLTEMVDAPRFATIVGLAEYGAHRMALGAATTGARRSLKLPSGAGVEGVVQRIKYWLQDFW